MSLALHYWMGDVHHCSWLSFPKWPIGPTVSSALLYHTITIPCCIVPLTDTQRDEERIRTRVDVNASPTPHTVYNTPSRYHNGSATSNKRCHLAYEFNMIYDNFNLTLTTALLVKTDTDFKLNANYSSQYSNTFVLKINHIHLKYKLVEYTPSQCWHFSLKNRWCNQNCTV